MKFYEEILKPSTDEEKIEHQKSVDSSFVLMKKRDRNILAQREKRRQRIEEERKERGYKKLRNRGVILENKPNRSAIKLEEGDIKNE